MRSCCPSSSQMDSLLTPCQPRWDLTQELVMDLCEYLYPTDGFLLPGDDMWKKFGLPESSLTPPSTPPYGSSDDDDGCSSNVDPLGDDWNPGNFLWSGGKDVRHDCMWAGLCCSEEHNKPRNDKDQKQHQHSITNSSDHQYHQHHHSHQESVLRTSYPEEEEEEEEEDSSSSCAGACVSEVKFDRDTSYHSSSDDTSDDSGEDEAPSPSSSDSSSASSNPYHSAFSDHSYFLPKRPAINTDHLGVQTPSDSEEEIDVVNVGTTRPILTPGTSLLLPQARTTFPEIETTTPTPSPPPMTPVQPQQAVTRTSLPANPSALVRRQLQVTMAVAAARKAPQAGRSLLMTNRPTTALLRVQERPATTGRPRRAVVIQPVKGRGRPANSTRRKTARKTGRRSAVQSMSDDDDDDDEMVGPGKRNMHNNMERQRRVAQRKMLANLRDQIPEMAGDERAPKVRILERAAQFCVELGSSHRAMEKEKARLQRNHDKLLKRLYQIQSSIRVHPY